MSAVLLKYLPWFVGALLIAGLGAYIAHRIDQSDYAKLSADFAAYRLTVAQTERDAQKGYADALQGQIDKANAQDQHNAQIIADLTAQRDHAAADRDFAQRLLSAARQAGSAAGPAVPTAADQSGASPATADASDRSLAQDLGAAAGECRDVILTLRALQAQITSQITPQPVPAGAVPPP